MQPTCPFCKTRKLSKLPPEDLNGDEKVMCLTCSIMADQLRTMRQVCGRRRTNFDRLVKHIQEHPHA